MRDLYKILGVKAEDDATIIRRRYRELAKELHPDRNGGDAKKTERFKEIAVAFAILGNEERRAKYDRERGSTRKTRPGIVFGEDFDEIVERIKTEGFSTELVEDFLDYSRKFQAEQVDRVARKYEQQRASGDKSSGKVGGILDLIEDIFGIDTSADGNRR